ncbi:hypothetical protein [Halosimplex marinum]|uniref:hypothetical protein n=1 Tax=Halosimplex marinum TaxID=3396620 RepID=UPI003F560CC4
MVLENVTLFEVHLDDAQFTADAGRADDRDDAGERDRPTAADAERVADVERVGDAEAAEREGSAEGSSGPGRFLKLTAASVAVSVLATVVARRIAGRDDDPVAVDPAAAGEFGDADDTDPSEPAVSAKATEREE